MEVNMVIILCLAAIFLIALALLLYFRTRGDVLGEVSKLIAECEETDDCGAVKMYNVVSVLYDMVPTPLQKIFTKQRLESIAQYIFDWMRKYADAYCAKLNASAQSGDVLEDTVKSETSEWVPTATEIIVEMMGMTLVELKEKAEMYGVHPEGLSTKKDFVAAIVKVILAGNQETE